MLIFEGRSCLEARISLGIHWIPWDLNPKKIKNLMSFFDFHCKSDGQGLENHWFSLISHERPHFFVDFWRSPISGGQDFPRNSSNFMNCFWCLHLKASDQLMKKTLCFIEFPWKTIRFYIILAWLKTWWSFRNQKKMHCQAPEIQWILRPRT